MKELNDLVRRGFGEERNYLLLLSAFCCSLLLVRVIYTGTISYLFLVINLMLAWIPYILSIAATQIKRGKQIVLNRSLLFLWLLFFPNTAYILTDLFHLHGFSSVPMWYDLILIVSFAWCGLLLGFHSVHKIHRRYFRKRNALANTAFTFSIFFLGGIGIYLGRYERWNSWEAITQPQQLFQELTILLSNEITVVNMIALALVFAVFLTILYLKFSLQKF